MRNFKSTLLWTLAAVGAILWLFAPSLARAADIRFVEDAEGQLQVFVSNDFELQQPTVAVAADNESATATGGVFYTLSPPGLSGSLIAYMLEDPVTRAISDVVHVKFSTQSGGFYTIAQVDVSFQSDSGSGSLGTLPPGIPAVVEDGTTQGLNTVFVDDQTSQPADLPANITIAAQSDAPTIRYNDFCDLSALILNDATAAINSGGPVMFGGACVLRLTDDVNQSGNAFLKSPLDVTASFSTAFAFQITDPIGGGADGFTFVVQSAANSVNAVGQFGGGLGYEDIQKSAAVEFDTFFNEDRGDDDNNHVGLDVNGSVDSVDAAYVSDDILKNGEVWFAWIDYDAAAHVLEVRLSTSNTRPTDPILKDTIDLASTLENSLAYVGFTSATGESASDHDIRFWSLEGTFGQFPELVSAASRKKHGQNGGLFDINLPLADPPAVTGVESRIGGPTLIVLEFNKPIEAADGTADGTEIHLSAGTLGPVDFNGTTANISLGGVPDKTCLRIRLSGITDTDGNPMTGRDTVFVRSLVGDVNGTGNTNILDLQAIKNHLNQQLDSSNARYDVGANGNINILDLQATKNNLQQSVACP